LEAQGKSNKDFESYKKALTIWIKVLGEGHPEVEMNYNANGSTLQAQGKCFRSLSKKL